MKTPREYVLGLWDAVFCVPFEESGHEEGIIISAFSAAMDAARAEGRKEGIKEAERVARKVKLGHHEKARELSGFNLDGCFAHRIEDERRLASGAHEVAAKLCALADGGEK